MIHSFDCIEILCIVVDCGHPKLMTNTVNETDYSVESYHH